MTSNCEIIACAQKALKRRLAASPNYDLQELKKVTELPVGLFPAQFSLNLDNTEKFRALCLLSQTALKPDFRISSHRKLIGPLIVGCKRAIWRIIRPQLEETIQGIESFCSWSVVSQAEQEVKMQRLESNSLKSATVQVSRTLR